MMHLPCWLPCWKFGITLASAAGPKFDLATKNVSTRNSLTSRGLKKTIVAIPGIYTHNTGLLPGISVGFARIKVIKPANVGKHNTEICWQNKLKCEGITC